MLNSNWLRRSDPAFPAAFAAIHGLPYAAKLYLLALTNIPFRVYFWVGAPVYILFAMVPVAAGSAVAVFDVRWLYLIVGVSLLTIVAGYWLRRRHKISGEAMRNTRMPFDKCKSI